MKKIYSNIKTLAALLVAGAAFTACSSSDSENIIEQPENPSAKTYTLTVQATLEGTQASTRGIKDEGENGLKVTWDGNETIMVYRADNNQPCGELSATPNANYPNNAQLFGTNLTGVDVGRENGTKIALGNNTYTGQLGTLEDIYSNHSYAIAYVTANNEPSGGNALQATTAQFKNQQAIIKLRVIKNGNPLKFRNVQIFDRMGGTLICSTSNGYYSNKGVMYLAIPSVNTNGLYFECDDDQAPKNHYGKELTVNKTLENGMFYTMDITMD